MTDRLQGSRRRRGLHLARRPLPRAPRDRQPRRAVEEQLRRRRHHQPVDLRRGARRRRAYDDQVARARRRGRRRRRGGLRAHHRRRPQRLRRLAAGLRRHRRRRRPGLDRGRPAPRPRHRRRPSPRPRRCGRRSTGRTCSSRSRPPEGLPGDHRGARRGHQRQRHADLRPRPLPRASWTPTSTGLEQAAGERPRPVQIHSVASFFVSRVDTEIDKRLDAIGTDEAKALQGQGRRRQRPAGLPGLRGGLRQRRAGRRSRPTARTPQRPLWASTGVKDPAYPRHDVRHRPRRRRHRQHDAGEDPRGRRRPRRGHRRHRRPADYAEAQPGARRPRARSASPTTT